MRVKNSADLPKNALISDDVSIYVQYMFPDMYQSF